jgi:imidazolonepropionase-like amidohydrolase
MRKTRATITFLLAALAALGGTAAMAATTVVTADRMLDVLAGKYVDKPAIVVVDGRITAVLTQGAAAIPPDATRIDLPGQTLLPGLIDMHVHLAADARIDGYHALDYTDSFWVAVGVANAKSMLEAGFTTVRNVGSSNYADVGIKQAVEGGYVPGPRIVPATYLLGATGGHCDETEGLPPSFAPVLSPGVADGPEAFRLLVRKVHKYGAEVIKLCVTGGVLSRTDTAGAQQMSYEEIKAAVDEAHRLGLKVAAHAHGLSGINDCLRAGCDTIEHASLANEESFRLAKEHGAWFSMDIYDDDYILAEGPKNGMFEESLAKERAIGLKQRQTFRAAYNAGVKMIFGTDNGAVFPAGQNALQFAKMVEWGMPALEAIRAATRNAAQALAREGDVGAIEVGRYGDFVAVKGDPLQDIRLLEHPATVIKGGERVK